MKASRIFILLLGVFLTQSVIANTIYLEYDPACMDRYEYQYKGVNSGFSHVVYHLRINDQEKVVLEVGIESKIDYETKPNDVRRCQDVSINERTVREINSGDVQVFIVKRSGNGFNVSPVGIGTYSQISSRGMGFSTVDHIFAYDYSQPANGANLARKGSSARVFYNGTLSHTCPKKFLFTKTKSKAGKNFSEMTIIPGVGTIQEKTGFNQTDAENNVLELVSINGVRLDSYLNGYCRANPEGIASSFYSNRKGSVDSPIFNNTIETDPIVVDNGNTDPSVNTTTGPGPINTTPTTTTSTSPFNCTIYLDLDKNVYMDRSTGLPANTSCGGNTYVNGQMVDAGAFVDTDPTPVETNPTNVVEVDPGPSTYIYCKEVSRNGVHVVQPSETLYGIARQYGTTVSEIKRLNNLSSNVINTCQTLYTQDPSTINPAEEDILVAKDGGNYYHLVKRGETLYQLANKYGYTVAKFKSINGLTSNVINVGQRLRISDCNCPTPESVPAPSSDVSVTAKDIPLTYAATQDRIVVENGPQKRSVHIVKENETIYSIAKAYKVSVDQLRALNNLEINEIIIPYQRIYLN